MTKCIATKNRFGFSLQDAGLIDDIPFVCSSGDGWLHEPLDELSACYTTTSGCLHHAFVPEPEPKISPEGMSFHYYTPSCFDACFAMRASKRLYGAPDHAVSKAQVAKQRQLDEKDYPYPLPVPAPKPTPVETMTDRTNSLLAGGVLDGSRYVRVVFEYGKPKSVEVIR